MDLTYTWEILGLKKANDPSVELNDIIVQTYWRVTGESEDGLKGTFDGATPFEPDKVDSENFTSYENLTETQVIGWIQDKVQRHGSDYWNHINSRISDQIIAQRGTVVNVSEADLPWKGVTTE